MFLLNRYRQKRSEQMMRKRGISFSTDSPLWQDDQVKLRTPEEVAKRALILYALQGVIWFEQPEKVSHWVQTEGLWSAITPAEMPLFTLPVSDIDPAEKAWGQKAYQSHAFTWRVEALWALLWIMGKVDKLPWPQERCDGGEIRGCVPELGESLAPFVQSASFRPVSEIMDEADLTFRLYTSLMESYTREQELPDNLEPGVVAERLVAFDWVLQYSNREWDHIL